jgi:hypothetical protein
VHRNRCFETEAAACKAARCGARDCRADDSAPVKVSCAGKAETPAKD